MVPLSSSVRQPCCPFGVGVCRVLVNTRRSINVNKIKGLIAEIICLCNYALVWSGRFRGCAGWRRYLAAERGVMFFRHVLDTREAV